MECLMLLLRHAVDYLCIADCMAHNQVLHGALGKSRLL